MRLNYYSYYNILVDVIIICNMARSPNKPKTKKAKRSSVAEDVTGAIADNNHEIYANDGRLFIHRYDSNLYPLCMTTATNNALQCEMMSCSFLHTMPLSMNWDEERPFDGNMLPEIDNAFAYLVLTNIIGGPTNAADSGIPTFTTVSQHFDVQGQRIEDLETYQNEHPGAVVRTIEEYTQVYKIFNGHGREEQAIFMETEINRVSSIVYCVFMIVLNSCEV